MALKRPKNRPDTVKLISNTEDDIWATLCRAIAEESFIPIISNTLRGEAIFPTEETAPETSTGFTVQEELVMEWATRLGYPLRENYYLERVAHYNYVTKERIPETKTDYLNFLNSYLLDIAAEDEAVAEVVPDLRKQLRKPDFGLTDITKELDYPHFENPAADPLRLLAKLRLPIYVTTSYYDFLQRLLYEEGCQVVHTHICPWAGNIDPAYLPSANFKPTPAEPVVYHLFGLDKVPASLVLSEDDYLDFLVKVAQDTAPVVKGLPGAEASQRLIPLYLWEALNSSALVLLGYRLQDWDFRILFRGIINASEAKLRRRSLAIQLDPTKQKGVENEAQARDYLEKYFRPPFKVEWDITNNFVKTLWQEWLKWQK